MLAVMRLNRNGVQILQPKKYFFGVMRLMEVRMHHHVKRINKPAIKSIETPVRYAAYWQRHTCRVHQNQHEGVTKMQLPITFGPNVCICGLGHVYTEVSLAHSRSM